MMSNGTSLAMTSPSSPATTEISNVQTASPSDTVIIKGLRNKQRQLGPAPFASFEDLSDDVSKTISQEPSRKKI